MDSANQIEAAVGKQVAIAIKESKSHNQKTVAEALKPSIKQPSLSDILRGESAFRLGYLLQACQILNIHPARFVGGVIGKTFFTVDDFKDLDSAQDLGRIFVAMERAYPETFAAAVNMYRKQRKEDPALNPDGKPERRSTF